MYSKVLVPVDLSHGEVGERIVAVARQLAGSTGSLVLLTVLESIPGYVAHAIPADVLERNRAAARQNLDSLAKKAGGSVTVTLREGKPSHEILEEAEASGCDCIVLGSHRPDLSDYLLGSTAARVVRHAGCSVLVDRTLVAG